jgi:hypothetical protein
MNRSRIPLPWRRISKTKDDSMAHSLEDLETILGEPVESTQKTVPIQGSPSKAEVVVTEITYSCGCIAMKYPNSDVVQAENIEFCKPEHERLLT